VRARLPTWAVGALGVLAVGALGIAATLATTDRSRWPVWLQPHHRWGWWAVLVLLSAAVALAVWQARRQANADSSTTTTVTAPSSGAVGGRDVSVIGGPVLIAGRDVASSVLGLGAGLRVHRLLQAVTRNRLDPAEQSEWAARAVTLVWAAWPADPWLPATWPRCGRLLPHALAAAAKAEEVVAAQEATGALLNLVGLYLWGRAELEAARATLERALKIFEAAYGPDHLHVATTLSNLCMVLSKLGELREARARLERVLAIRGAAQGPDHPDVAAALLVLGGVLTELGELPQARVSLERALAIFEAAYGPDHLNVAATLSNLSLVLRQLEELPLAQACDQRAQTIRQRLSRSN
jgi:tetratricopeptide (TPR) repeat protein